MKSFLSFLRQLDSSNDVLCDRTASQLFTTLLLSGAIIGSSIGLIARGATAAPLNNTDIYVNYSTNSSAINQVRTISPSGVLSPLLFTTGVANTAALGLDPVNLQLYYSDRTLTPNNLRRYDGTNQSGSLGTFAGSSGSIPMVRMGFRGGVGYGVANDNTMYTFTTGSPTSTINSLGLMTFQGTSPSGSTSSGDIAFDGYGFGWAIFGNSLYRINLNSGVRQAIPIGQITVGGVALPVSNAAGTGVIVGSIAFDAAGDLYIAGIDAVANVFQGTNIYRVNVNDATAVQVGSTLAGGFITDMASGSQPNIAPIVTATKSVSPNGLARPGDTLTYTIEVENTGTAPAVNLDFTDVLPAATTYVANSATLNGLPISGATYPFATVTRINGRTSSAGALKVGYSNRATITFKVTINTTNVPTSVTNQGTIVYLDGPTTNTTPAATTISTVNGYKSAKLTIDADGSGTITPGDTVTWTISYKNFSAVPANNFQINDELPSGVTVSSTGGQTVVVSGSGTSATKNIAYTGVNTSNLLDTGSILAPGGVVTVNIPTVVNSGFTGALNNQSNATGSSITGTGSSSDNVDNTSSVPAGITVPAGSVVQAQTTNIDPTSVNVVAGRDFGDAPSSYGSASHSIVSGTYLGATVTAEGTDYNSVQANGDTGDDGITSFPPLTAGATSYTIPAASITATGTGTLHAWIDFNKNGTFEIGEYTSIAITNNTPAGSLDWTGITASAGNTFARFRFTNDATVTASTPNGIATDGEVEDYQVSIGAAVLACGTIYGSYNNSGTFNSLRSYSPPDGTPATQIATLTTTGGTTTAVAALAVDPLLDSSGNRRVYYMENTGTGAKLFYYNGSNITDTGIALTVPYSPISIVRSDGSAGSLTNSFNRMGFAPDGTLYVADGQKTFYRFSPNRSGTSGFLSAANTITDNPNNDIGNFGRAQVGQSGGGDIAFDNAGRMYIVTYDSNNSNVPTEFRLFQIINPQSSTPTAILLGKAASTDPVAGLAFQASDNTLYMQGSGGKSFGWNLGTNVVTSLPLTTPGSADLGSCTYPDLNPTGAFIKTVANITNPGTNILSANDILEYTLNVTNNGNLVAGNTTLIDTIPTGTTYVAGSTTLNGIAKADNSGAMPYSNTVNPKLINSPGEASGVLTTGAARKATVVFRVKVNAVGTKVCNQSNFFYDGSLPVGIVSDDPTTTAVADDQTCTGVNKAKLLLVKRITAIKRNNQTVPENFTTFVDDSSSATTTSDDNHCNWPGSTGSAGACTNTYTVGKTFLPDVQTGDEIEYTIYYLNGGGNPAKQAKICDQLDANLTFQTQFDSSNVTTVGKGLALAAGNSSVQYLTNTGVDTDNGQLTTPSLATSCNLGARVGSNLSNKVVVVDVGTTTSPLMNSTSAGTPTTSYGYIRFKAKVN